MTKRAFERVDGYLVDEFEGPDGKPTVRQFPESVHRTTSPDRREQAIAAMRSGPGPYHGTLIDDGDDGSTEYCDALLDALDNGAVHDVPHALLKHLRDERVRSALIAALRARGHINVAQVVGIAGGPGALDALREQYARLVDDEGTFRDTGWSNDHALMLTTVCSALLELSPDDLSAAECLLRLFTHPVSLNRLRAVGAAARVCEGSLQTGAMEHLREGLDRFVTGEDDRLFVAALPGLGRASSREEIVRRVQSIALGEDPQVAGQALGALCSLLFLASERNRILLLCLENDPPLATALYCISWLAVGPWPDKATEFVQKALADSSPSLRWDAISVLQKAPHQLADDLTAQALVDEPDPLLRRLLASTVRDRPIPDRG